MVKIGDWVELNAKGLERFVVLLWQGDTRAKVRSVGRKWIHVTTSGGINIKLEKDDFAKYTD